MATNFPASLDSFTTHSSGQVISSADINKIQDAALALETKLGTGSRFDSYADGAFIRGTNHVAAHDPRIGQSIQLVAGTIYFWGFTAPWSWTTTTVRWNTTANSGGAGTLQGFALYSNDGAEALTLLTSVSSSNLIASSTGIRTTTWGSSQPLTKGTRYAVACLMTGTVTGTTLWGTNLAGTGPTEFLTTPRMMGTFAGQTGFPSSVTAANWNTAASVNPWGSVL